MLSDYGGVAVISTAGRIIEPTIYYLHLIQIYSVMSRITPEIRPVCRFLDKALSAM